MRKLKLEELNRLSPTEYKNHEKNPVILVLDNVRSLNNVGSAFRTGDAFNINKIFLCGITGTPPNKEINKTALGATETVNWEYREDIICLLKELKKDGWKIIAVEQAEGSTYLQDYHYNENDKTCYIFGNEVFGVNDHVMDIVDYCLEIPQFGTKHSLNISVTIGVVLWDRHLKISQIFNPLNK
ncbi:MAG: RNA methyltransferase [Cytophagaceae bacterium]